MTITIQHRFNTEAAHFEVNRERIDLHIEKRAGEILEAYCDLQFVEGHFTKRSRAIQAQLLERNSGNDAQLIEDPSRLTKQRKTPAYRFEDSTSFITDYCAFYSAIAEANVAVFEQLGRLDAIEETLSAFQIAGE